MALSCVWKFDFYTQLYQFLSSIGNTTTKNQMVIKSFLPATHANWYNCESIMPILCINFKK